MSLHLMWGPFGSCRSFRLFERVLRQRPRHQRQHVIACDVGFFFPRRFFFRRFKTTAPVAAACWSSGLYKRRTTESLNPNYHVSSGSPSSQVKLDLEVAGKSVFLREKHWISGIVEASSTRLTALAVFCVATLEHRGSHWRQKCSEQPV